MTVGSMVVMGLQIYTISKLINLCVLNMYRLFHVTYTTIETFLKREKQL